MKKFTPLLVYALPALLAACGGGGGDATGNTSRLKHPGTDTSSRNGSSAIDTSKTGQVQGVVQQTEQTEQTEQPQQPQQPQHPQQTQQTQQTQHAKQSDKTNGTKQANRTNRTVVTNARLRQELNSDPYGYSRRIDVHETVATTLGHGLKKSMAIKTGFFEQKNGNRREVHGTKQLTISTLTGAMFDNAEAFASVQRVSATQQLPNGAAKKVANIKWTDYYDDQLRYLGSRSENITCVAKTSRKYPDSVKAGDFGLIGMAACYAPGHEQRPIRTHTLSYAVRYVTTGGLLLRVQTDMKNDVTDEQWTVSQDYEFPPHGNIAFAGFGMAFESPRGENLNLDVED